MEQTARALNVLCRCWLERRCDGSRIEQTAFNNRYYQARNQAAKRARLPMPRKNE